MSVYRPKGSPFYHYDFQHRGHRFHGSTKAKNKREAEAVERAERERAKQAVAAVGSAELSLRLDDVAGVYWSQVGQHHVCAGDTWRQLERLVEFFGKDALLTDIDDADVASLVAWRRGHRVVRDKRRPLAECPLILPRTVNHTTLQLKKLFNRMKTLNAKFQTEPKWSKHMLPEPQERVRELVGDEQQRLEEATRRDYQPFFDFAHASGQRLKACFLKWPEVRWDESQIVKQGKGGHTVTIPLTPGIRAILLPLRGHHPEFVFTYVCIRANGDRVKGKRYPITYSGLKTTWKRLRRKAGITDFRFHDFRHDVGTKILRRTGNLKLVQKVLGHRNIETTMRYAHVLDSDVAEALQQHAESRKKSRSGARKVS